jgi:hypothetical protein
VTRSRRTIAALALTAAALVGACSDGDDDSAASTTTAEATTTTTEATTTTTQAPACPAVSVPGGAQEVTELDGDADGDGTDDELRTYRVGEEEWHLQVELAADGGADLVLPSFGGGVGLIGGADVDGDGQDEVWARTGSGASATIVGLAKLVDCALVRVTFPTGELAELPIGGSVGTTSGVACGDAVLTAYTATFTEGSTYEVAATTYGLEGTALLERGTDTTTVDATDPEFIRYTSFSCGDLSL